MFADPTGQIIWVAFAGDAAFVVWETVWLVAQITTVGITVQTIWNRYQAGCETLVTPFDIIDIVFSTRLKWLKLYRLKRISGAGKNPAGGGAPGFMGGGGGGNPPVPTRPGGPGGPGAGNPGGGGGSGGPGGGGFGAGGSGGGSGKPPSGGSPALKGDPYHPDRVNSRSKDNKARYNDSGTAADELGYSTRIPPQKAPFNSHGQPVFSNGKNYISPDVDGHNVSGGWKMFDRNGRRTGTYSPDLSTRIKD